MEPKTKYLLIGAGVLAVGGYFIYQKYLKNDETSTSQDLEEKLDIQPSVSQSQSTPKPKVVYVKPKVVNSEFPLKYGSRGTLVKDVQLALIRKNGSSILPKYGADGYFGTEMVTALRKLNLPSFIDQKIYSEIIQGKSSDKAEDKKPTNDNNFYSPEIIADLLYSGISQGNINTALRGLWKIKNVMHYIKINEIFKQKRIGSGVRKTIVTALAIAFPIDPEKTKYRAQLYRIGLKWRNDKWALAGITKNRLITIKRVNVMDAEGQSMVVPENTILGEFLGAKNGLTEFKTVDGKTLYADTNAISFYHD
jgi:hypothetical protein